MCNAKCKKSFVSITILNGHCRVIIDGMCRLYGEITGQVNQPGNFLSYGTFSRRLCLIVLKISDSELKGISPAEIKCTKIR